MRILFILPVFLLFHSIVFAQLVLEKDINQQAASSDPIYMAELDGILYFRANDGINGEELYSYNLTSEEVQLVANLGSNDEGSNVSEITALNGRIYFRARVAGSTYYLYVYDPENGNVERVDDMNGDRIEEPAFVTAFEGQLYFSADFGDAGIELGKYDPSANLISLVGDINPDGDSNPGGFTAVGSKLWFYAQDGVNDSRLWHYDSATEDITRLDYDSPNNLYPSINELHHHDGQILFSGHTTDTGSDFWVYDIMSNSLLDIPEIYPGPASGSPFGFTTFDDLTYFSGRDLSSGREVRVYNPQTQSVSLLEDINPDGHSTPAGFTVLDGLMYFIANGSDEERRLYAYNSVGNELSALAGLDSDGAPTYLSVLAAANGSLFLSGLHPEVGNELLSFTPGDSEIEVAADINLNTIGSDPYEFTSYNGKLYFGADEVTSGQEIWVYDPATGNTDILSDTPASLRPNGFTELDGKLFFSGIHPEEGYGLLYYDDATGEVTATSYITPSSIGHITNITAYQDKLYFHADDEMVDGEIFVYDPSTNEYELLADINSDGSSNPEELMVFNEVLYFQANDGVSGRELWQYNAATNDVSLVADINPGEEDSNPGWLTAYDDKLYFSAYMPSLAYDIYSYDPATGAISQHTDVSGNLNPAWLKVYKDKLFFNGRYSSGVNVELLCYDANTDELILTEDLNPNGASNPYYLTVWNDKLYFTAFTEDYGREIWEYNDTTLSIISDIRPGVPDSDPEYLTVFNDKLYFAANDGLRGSEIWSLAACLNLFVATEPQQGGESGGSIDLTVNGGLPPYTYTWSTGADTEDIDNLEQGEYTVTVTDASGCLSELTAIVGFVSGVDDYLSEAYVKVYPNPTSGNFTVRVEGKQLEAIEIYDLSGKLIDQHLLKMKSEEASISFTNGTPGIYYLKLHVRDGVMYKKLVISN